jgi:hypothetical protein
MPRLGRIASLQVCQLEEEIDKMSTVSPMRRRVHLPCRENLVARLRVYVTADALGGASRLSCRRTGPAMSAIGARPARFHSYYR